MIPYQWTSIGIATVVAVVILYLVRHHHLQSRQSLWWIGVALAMVILAAIPGVVDRAASLLGVHYPPTLLLVMGLAALLIKLLTLDVERSQQALRTRRLIQRVAMLEARLAGLEKGTAHGRSVAEHRPRTARSQHPSGALIREERDER